MISILSWYQMFLTFNFLFCQYTGVKFIKLTCSVSFDHQLNRYSWSGRANHLAKYSFLFTLWCQQCWWIFIIWLWLSSRTTTTAASISGLVALLSPTDAASHARSTVTLFLYPVFRWPLIFSSITSELYSKDLQVKHKICYFVGQTPVCILSWTLQS